MSRAIPILSAACVVGIGITGWLRLAPGEATAQVPETATPPEARQPAETALHAARRHCSVEALDAVVADLVQRTRTAPQDAEAWHVLAEAHLERAQQRSHLRGIVVGEPVFTELPEAMSDDLDAGLAAAAEARRLGDDSGTIYRIEAGLMSQRITGLSTALQWNGKITEALRKAGEKAGEDPSLHTALGLRKMLAPSWFGHDPAAALEHFTFAAEAGDDERPAVFAAMATYLQHKRQQAIEWLQRAVTKNPDNKFARVVLRRLRRGEEDPFGRDVTASELAAAK
ncbi:MAG: hypothetical protein H6835_14740 [Planctomycetes bacterium]|nr:hypothetical protein [Planctomycetota bacterium]